MRSKNDIIGLIIDSITSSINMSNREYFNKRGYEEKMSISASGLDACWKQIALKLKYGTPPPSDGTFENVAYAWTGTVMHREALGIASKALEKAEISYWVEHSMQSKIGEVTLIGQTDLVVYLKPYLFIIDLKFPSYWQFQRYKKDPAELAEKYSTQMTAYDFLLRRDKVINDTIKWPYMVACRVIAIHGNEYITIGPGGFSEMVPNLKIIQNNIEKLEKKTPDGITIPSYPKECQYCPFYKSRCNGAVK